MRWIYNTCTETAIRRIRELHVAHNDRGFVIDRPKASDRFSVEQLESMDLVGIYEVEWQK